MKLSQDIYTPEQVAQYLQLNKETVYRYIRDGRLLASKFGRTYRVPRQSIDSLLWAQRTRQDIKLREYSAEQLEEFIEADRLSSKAKRIVKALESILT